MNDDLQYRLLTDNAQFDMSIDTWGSCFILGEDQQEELGQIERILDLSSLFSREGVESNQ